MITTCIFDLDGVVVDTAKYHYLAWKRLANELNFDFTEEQSEATKGVSRMVSLDILLDLGGLKDSFTDEQKQEMATRKNDWYCEDINTMASDEILPGVLDFLKDLKRNNINIVLGSASKNAHTILVRCDLLNYFDAIVDGTMVSNAKPDPEVFLKGAELVGESPSRCVVFEDAKAGIEAATRAGMYSIGVGLDQSLSQANIQIDSFESFNIDHLKQFN